jgi:hypothetical protein
MRWYHLLNSFRRKDVDEFNTALYSRKGLMDAINFYNEREACDYPEEACMITAYDLIDKEYRMHFLNFFLIPYIWCVVRFENDYDANKEIFERTKFFVGTFTPRRF